jgi:hypothetical protein
MATYPNIDIATPSEKISRRSFFIGAGTVAAGVLLAACGATQQQAATPTLAAQP